MEWLAVIGMGLVLGALGGGGGILTVPILVGLFGMAATEATGASLFIVGLTSVAGAVRGLAKRTVDWQHGLFLAVPSSVGAFAARAWLVPAIPETLGGLRREQVLLGGFALLMIFVGIRALRAGSPPDEPRSHHPALVGLVGLVIGVVSGTFGAGGGFLILPALVFLLGMDLKRAIPTSLMVIAIQSLIGFTGELTNPQPWPTLLSIAGVALVGLGIGTVVQDRAPRRALQIAFGILVLLVAAWMLWRVR